MCFCYEIKLVVSTKNQILLDDTMFSVCPMCQATVCSLRLILLIALHRPINESARSMFNGCGSRRD